MKVVIYTADVGGHDDCTQVIEQHLPAGVDAVRWVRFTENERREESEEAGWEHRRWAETAPVIRPLPDQVATARLHGRWLKTHPHVLFPGADFTLWLDARVQVTSDEFLAGVLGQMRPDADGGLFRVHSDYGLFVHPDRNSPEEEAEASATLGKYPRAEHQTMLTELRQSLGRGVVGLGLWASTVQARFNSSYQLEMDHLLWTETLAWSRTRVVNEQVALPFLNHMLGHQLTTLEFACVGDTLWRNSWFRVGQHRRDT